MVSYLFGDPSISKAQVKDRIILARALIEDGRDWTKGEYWIDAYGDPANSPEDTVRMCAVGAVCMASDARPAQSENIPEYQLLRDVMTRIVIIEIHKTILGITPEELNDSYGHEMALTMFQYAFDYLDSY